MNFVIAEKVMEALVDLNSDIVQVTPDGECNMNNAEDRQQAQHERDTSPMDLECTPLPTDAEIKEMFDSIKQHLVHEKEDELAENLRQWKASTAKTSWQEEHIKLQYLASLSQNR